MNSIKIQDLVFSINTKPILQSIQLEIQPGEFFLLLGPSGCGKTTLLRLIAGFYHPLSGSISFNDRVMNSVSPHERNIGMVFQSYALFPHMTVSQNVEYGLKIRNMSKQERRTKVSQALEMVRLTGYESRVPGSLSGGEQQRVALARALVISPNILLLDEPLSNLDAKLRIQMRQELREIHRKTNVTTINVTHDQEEALAMADRIAIMNKGQILQIGSPDEIYYHPANSFVAGFIGEANMLSGGVLETTSDSKVSLQTPIGKLLVQAPDFSVPPNSSITCCIRPEYIQLLDSQATMLPNQFNATVLDYQFKGDSMELVLRIGSATLRAIQHNPRNHIVERNQTITITISPQDILLLKD
jgi:iron(III) transport system ATP-binding protein